MPLTHPQHTLQTPILALSPDICRYVEERQALGSWEAGELKAIERHLTVFLTYGIASVQPALPA